MAFPDQLHQRVFEELSIEFNQNTKLELDPEGTASDLINAILQHNIFLLLDAGKIEWGGKARRFTRACAANLARAAEAYAEKAGATVIDADALKAAMIGDPSSNDTVRQAGLIVFWESICPLPSPRSTSENLLLGCTALRGLLGMRAAGG